MASCQKSAKPFLLSPLEVLARLCVLLAQESQGGHHYQAIQAVLGLPSLPLSQGGCRRMNLPFVQVDLVILFHQLGPSEKNGCLYVYVKKEYIFF